MNKNITLSSAYVPLRLTYGLVPIVAGLDKFTNLLADWASYLPEFAVDLLPVSPGAFMMIVGVIEIIAGIVVLSPFVRLGAHVVMAWLILIAVTLVLAGHFDVAVRDLVMAVGAYTLGQLAALRGEPWIPGAARQRGALAHAGAN